MPWRPKDPSTTWRSFLHNHMHCLAAIDMFVVVTSTFRLLYALIVLGHDRRKVIHFEVTETPTQDWLARRMTEAFPWDTTPRFLLRDRDASYGQTFRDRVAAMGIEEVVTAPRSPWQNPFVERIGSIRRECLNHVIIFDERHLRGVLSSYFQYYHKSRTHLSLDKDYPETRPMHPPIAGKIIAFREVGGLHHRYERAPHNMTTEPSMPALRWLREPISNCLTRQTAGRPAPCRVHCSHGEFTFSKIHSLTIAGKRISKIKTTF